METVERALGDLCVASAVGAGRGGGRRGHSRHGEAKDITKCPQRTFISKGLMQSLINQLLRLERTKDGGEDETGPSDETKEKAYNPQNSFFDSLSSSTQSPPPARGGAGGRGGGGRGGSGPGGRNRIEERERAECCYFWGTWWMGPGAYVGGWGGFGMRATRPRRAGAPVVNGR